MHVHPHPHLEDGVFLGDLQGEPSLQHWNLQQSTFRKEKGKRWGGFCKVMTEVAWMELSAGTREIISQEITAMIGVFDHFCYVERQSYFSCIWDQRILFPTLDMAGFSFFFFYISLIWRIIISRVKSSSMSFFMFSWLYCCYVILPTVKFNKNLSSVWSKTEVNYMDQLPFCNIPLLFYYHLFMLSFPKC